MPVRTAPTAQAFRRAAAVAAWTGIGVAVAALLGWAIDVAFLRTLFLADVVSMNPMTAAAFALAGTSLLLLKDGPPTGRRRRFARAAAWGVVAVAAGSAVSRRLFPGHGLDELLFASRLNGNHMAPNTVGGFLAVGAALVLLDAPKLRGMRPSQPFVLAAAALALFSVAGYMYSVDDLFRVGTFIPMAPNTAITFAAVCVGLVCCRADREPVVTLTADTAGGLMARRMLPAAFLVPLLFGWARLLGERAGLYDLAFGISMFSLSMAATFSALIWWNARDLKRLDLLRRCAQEQADRQHAQLAEVAESEHSALKALERSTEALGHERFLLHTLLDNLPDSIYFKDAESRFLRISRGQASWFGLSDPATAIGRTDADFFSDEHAARARDDEAQIMRTGRPLIGIEEKETWPDGRETWVITSKLPMRDRGGKMIGTFGISRDITNQKRTERELREAKETAVSAKEAADEARRSADAANHAKSAFLANMSHEIRTPMNAVLGMTELVLDTALTDGQREYLQMVHTSGEALLALLDDILDFSKIEAGKIEMERTRFGLRETLGDAIKPLGVRADRKGLELVLHVAPEVPDGLVGDPNRLRQVIVNLVGNAIKFTERGEVVVEVVASANGDGEATDGSPAAASAGSARRDASPPATDAAPPLTALLRFAVRDTGIGIPEEKRAAVFEAFEQADTSTTRRYGGTGLGLAISMRLVELMGGRIRVDSEVGAGSEFHFTVSFRVADEPPAWLPTARLDGLPVLVVDDNATNRLILEETLRGWGMRPTSAEGVDEAIARLDDAARRGEPYRLVLTDANMPDRDGFDPAGEVKEARHLESPVVMMLTSGARPGDFARCEERSIGAYLIKPIKQADLYRAVTAALGRSSAAASGSTAAVPVAVGVDVPGATPAAEPTAASLKILLAEDSPVNQRLAVGLLNKWGHEVTVAGNGREALDRLAEGRFDVVLMDVQMPEMDGLEATAALREREQGAAYRTPVIAMTAHAMSGDRERCLAAGMDGYVTKPIRRPDLQAALADLPRVCGAGPP